MAEVSVQVNGRVYPVGCEDGQEEHVLSLARIVDQRVAQVAREVGQLGETRLFLLASLLLADELSELRSSLNSTTQDRARMEEGASAAEQRAISALEAAAGRIEALAAQAG